MESLRLDHIVLTVSDISQTLEFYATVLGLTGRRASDGRVWLESEGFRINLHQAGAERQPHAARPTPGSADFCLVAEITAEEMLERLEESGVEVELGPVEREVAAGMRRSLYIRDPDGNLVELACG